MKFYCWLLPLIIPFLPLNIFAQHLHIDHAPGQGIFVDAPGKVGIIVDSALVGAQILHSKSTGLELKLNQDHGIWVDSTGLNGIQIERTKEHGIKILRAHSNGIDISQISGNGINIDGAQRGLDIAGINEGMRITGAQNNGITVNNPFQHGIEIIASGHSGAFIRNTESQGVDVLNTGASGVRVREAGTYGVRIEGPNAAGMIVTEAGAQGVVVDASTSHSFHSLHSKGKGAFIVGPDLEGLHILNSGLQGVTIDSAGADGIGILAPADDGITVTDPVDDGINIINPGGDGIHINGAGSSAGLFITTATSTEPSVYITHSNDDEFDLHIGGDAKIKADGKYEIQLDGDNAIADAFFQIRNSDGALPFIVSESGDLAIAGHLSKGSGSFKIDHPLDPKNKYLYHSFVESPDMMNIYNGNVVLDQNGEATITMPDWFESLNRDFRYQLTPIGDPADLYVAQEISQRSFRVAGGSAGLKVSWQVTGIRQDRYANAHRLQVEVDKEDKNKGTYLHPGVWNDEIPNN